MEYAPTTDSRMIMGIKISLGISTILENTLMPVKPKISRKMLPTNMAPMM